MPENAIQEYIDTIEDLREVVDESKNKILDKIDIKQLFINPEEHLNSLGLDYYEANEDLLRKAVDTGEKKANKILNNYVDV